MIYEDPLAYLLGLEGVALMRGFIGAWPPAHRRPAPGQCCSAGEVSFLIIPVGHGLVYCYADITTDRAGRPDGDPVERLRERFAGFATPVPWLLDQLDDPARVHAAPIEQVAEERWGRGAVVLVGDAAHGMSPTMAEGASLAFEDALVLAASLRDAKTVREALAGFVTRRQTRMGWVRAQTHRRDRTRNLPAGPAEPRPAYFRPADLPVRLPAAATAHLSRLPDQNLQRSSPLLGCIPANRTQQEPLIGMLRMQVSLHWGSSPSIPKERACQPSAPTPWPCHASSPWTRPPSTAR